MSTYNQGNPSVSQVISASNVFVYGNTSSGNALSVQQLGAGNVASFRTQTGASALFVSSAGNVGVGITNPIAQLHAYQSNGTGYQLSINNIYNTGGSNYSAFIHSDQAFCGGTGGVGQYTYSGAGLLVTSYPNNTSNNSGYTAYFGTSDNSAGSLAPQMVIKAATGNVGIGTTNPTEVGQVGSLLHIYDASVNNPTMTVDATGGTGQARIRLKAGLAPSTFRANRIDFYSNTNLIWTQITDYNQNGTNEMSFVSLGKGYASGSVLTLTQAGNVGIGITNPGYPLTVNGEARASQFTTTTGSFYSALSSSGTTFVGSAPGTNIQIWSGSADTRIYSSSATPINFGVNSSGSSAGNNVGIGLTGPSYQLDLSTDGARKLTSTTWLTGSDQRIKTDIQSAKLQMCYDTVKSIDLKYFKWNFPTESNVVPDDKHSLGFIAQEVKTVFPNAVSESNSYGYSDFLSLNTDQILKAMYGALKQTMADKEALEQSLSSLEQRLAAAGL